jgi:choline dehydrogenase
MYEIVIVGAGAAGCAIAGKLSEDTRLRVLLIEAGPPPNSVWIRIPAGMARIVTTGKYNWDMMAHRTEGDNRNPLPVLVGKTLGGGSAINGMVYMRSYAAAFDSWAEFGIEGWGWSEVLEAYRRMERHEDGESAMHGSNGPLRISRSRYHHRSAAAFVQAGGALGARMATDLNDGESVDSIGLVQRNQDRGLRCSSYDAFVRPPLKRKNLDILTAAHARRIILEDGRATGIEYEQDGVIKKAMAKREVILSSGAIFSPHLLQLSGIGPGEHLRKMGVPVAVDLPGVGANMQEHAGVTVRAKTVRRASMNRDLEGISVLMHGLYYLLTRRGPITMGASQAVAMIRSRPDLAYPNLQMGFRPFTLLLRPDRTMGTGPGNAIEASCYLMSPKSRGTVRLRSPDPHDRPVVTYNFLAEQEDQDALFQGVRWLQRCFQAPPFQDLVTGDIDPPPSTSDDEIHAFIRDTISSGMHAASTCSMGKAGSNAVVDSKLRVHGVAGLRVADASIMPLVTAGNTNAPSIMIGTRAAEFIRADR